MRCYLGSINFIFIFTCFHMIWAWLPWYYWRYFFLLQWSLQAFFSNSCKFTHFLWANYRFSRFYWCQTSFWTFIFISVVYQTVPCVQVPLGSIVNELSTLLMIPLWKIINKFPKIDGGFEILTIFSFYFFFELLKLLKIRNTIWKSHLLIITKSS